MPFVGCIRKRIDRMSMLSEQVKELRTISSNLSIGHNMSISLAIEYFREAADTIETLSAKLSAANMERSTAYYNDGWIPCSERLPEEKINPITKDFCEYQVTFKIGNIKDIRHYKFGRGHWWNGTEMMDEYVTAWRMHLTPYEE